MLALLLTLALGQQGQSAKDARFPPMPIPNAFQAYESAMPLVVGSAALSHMQPLYMQDETSARVTPELERAVQQSADAFEGIRKGIGQIYMQPRVALGTYPEPFAQNQQILGKLLLASGDVHAAHGEIKAATADYVDLLRFGNQLVNSGEGTSPLVGMNLMEHARGSLWRLSPQMTFDQLADAASLLHQFSASQSPYSALLARDERMLLYQLADVWKASNIMFSVYQHLGIDPFHSPSDLTPDQIRPITHLQVRDDAIAFFDGWIERTSKQFSTRGKQPSYEEAAGRHDAVLAYMCRHGRMPPVATDLYWYVFLRNQTADGLAAGALATRAYLKKEGKMPKAFADYGPSLFSSLPPDPFALSGKIQATFGDGFVSFRSVGPGSDPNAPSHSLIPSPHPDPKGELANEGPLVWNVKD